MPRSSFRMNGESTVGRYFSSSASSLLNRNGFSVGRSPGPPLADGCHSSNEKRRLRLAMAGARLVKVRKYGVGPPQPAWALPGPVGFEGSQLKLMLKAVKP